METALVKRAEDGGRMPVNRMLRGFVTAVILSASAVVVAYPVFVPSLGISSVGIVVVAAVDQQLLAYLYGWKMYLGPIPVEASPKHAGLRLVGLGTYLFLWFVCAWLFVGAQ